MRFVPKCCGEFMHESRHAYIFICGKCGQSKPAVVVISGRTAEEELSMYNKFLIENEWDQ